MKTTLMSLISKQTLVFSTTHSLSALESSCSLVHLCDHPLYLNLDKALDNRKFLRQGFGTNWACDDELQMT